jgi:hypothetical protein
MIYLTGCGKIPLPLSVPWKFDKYWKKYYLFSGKIQPLPHWPFSISLILF